MNPLIVFARRRHLLMEAERLSGDEVMLLAEHRTAMCVWALDVLGHIFRGEADEASALAAKGPPRVAMDESISVAYARQHHRLPRPMRVVGDHAFETIQSMTESSAAAVDVLARALVSWSVCEVGKRSARSAA